MINGVTKNIAINPVGFKNLDPLETLVPVQIDFRNGRVTEGGNWAKRAGYGLWKDLGTKRPVETLIPEGKSYAISGKKIFNLDPLAELTQGLNGKYRPTWANHKDILILCDGGEPVKINIEANTSDLLQGSPPKARFIARVSSYTIMSGYEDAEGEWTEFKWCASENPENWSGGNSGFSSVKKTGEKIRQMKGLKEKIFFFKDKSIEVWVNIGKTGMPFVRQEGLWMDKGLGADYSLVEANDTFYWYGNDGNFYGFDGSNAKPLLMSYRRYFDQLKAPEQIIGFDFRKENKIRWIAPNEGLCFSYDYINDRLSEDNVWDHGWERLPINSYMELGGGQYFGDYDLSGKIYRWSDDYETDDGKPIRVYRRFSIVPSDKGHRCRFNRIAFRVKRGEGIFSGNPLFFFRYRFDQGKWRETIYPNLGLTGDRNPWIEFFSLGVGREMEIEIVQTGEDFLLTNCNLTINELGR